MATKVVGKLGVDVSANTGNLEQGMQRAKRAVNDASRAMQRSARDAEGGFGGLINTVGRLRGAVAGIAAAGGLTLLTRNALNAADAAGEAAARIGISAEELQKFQFAAKLSGLETATLETGLRFLNRQIAEGKLPYESLSQAIADIAERSRAAATPLERNAILVEAFGSRAGSAFTEFTQRGAIGLELLGRQAEELGIVFSQDLVDGAAEFNDALDIIGLSVSRNFQTGLLEPFVQQGQRLQDTFTDPAFLAGVQGVGTAVGFILNLVAQQVGRFGQFVQLVDGFAERAREFVSGGDVPLLTDAAKIEELQRKNAEILRNGAQINPGLTGKVGTFKASNEATKAAEQQEKAAARILDGLRKESEQLEIQVDLYGLKQGVIEATTRRAEIARDLQQQGIQLSKEESAEVETLLQNIQRQKNAYEELEQQQKKIEEAERARQQAIQDLGFTFESAFENAIFAGEKLSDTLRALAQDVARIAFRSAVTQPLGAGVAELFSGGGGLFGSIFGSSPASGIGPSQPGLFAGLFADGGFIPPGTFGIAGEAGAEVILGGRSGKTVVPMDGEGVGGGNSYYIDARGADAGAVARIEQSLLALAGPGVIERRVVNAQNRGAL